MDLIDEDAPVGNAPEFSVSELSGAVKRVVEVDGLSVGGDGEAAGVGEGRVHQRVPAGVVDGLVLLHGEAGADVRGGIV